MQTKPSNPPEPAKCPPVDPCEPTPCDPVPDELHTCTTIMQVKRALAGSQGSIITKDQVRLVISALESVVENAVHMTKTTWDDLIWSIADKAVFNDANVDRLCALLGIV